EVLGDLGYHDIPDADGIAPTAKDSETRSGTPMFEVKTGIPLDRAIEMVKSGDLAAILEIPRDFSKATIAHNYQRVKRNLVVGGFEYAVTVFKGLTGQGDPDFTRQFKEEMERLARGEQSLDESELFTDRMTGLDTEAEAVIRLRGDIADMRFGLVARIVDVVIAEFLAAAEAEANSTVFKNLPFKPPADRPRVTVSVTDIKERRSSMFDYQVPGLIIYAIMLLTIHVTASLAAEEEKRTLERMKLTPMTGANLLGGLMLAWLLVAVAQVLLLFGTALLVGYEPQGSIGFGIVIGLIAAVPSIALGLALTSFISKEKQASGLGTLVVVPLSFLTGAFFPIPNPTLIPDLLGRRFGVFDILPWTHAIRAMRLVVSYDKSPETVLYDLAWTLALALALFALGVALFTRRRLRRG
ncbi:MAG: ABC transporter permease, partial [Planctomycetota bacterium]|nr:ABC transporter permease [Planctomycetota bacterium]